MKFRELMESGRFDITKITFNKKDTGLKRYNNLNFSYIINKRKSIISIKPYGNFIIGSGHFPKCEGGTVDFMSWLIKCPDNYNTGLLDVGAGLGDLTTREAALKKLIMYLKRHVKR